MALPQFGQYPAPRHTVAHLSDTHLLAAGALQYGVIDPEAGLRRALERLGYLELPPQVIVVTGDLTDLGEPEAYVRVKKLVDEAAAGLGAETVWVMGNHDDRGAYAEALFGVTGPERLAPQDRVQLVDGLRIVSLDSTVPGFHHGELEASQLDWLRDVLSTPAEHGTLIAMHHPPVPLPMDRISQVIELEGQAAFAEVLAGTDVRAIIAGHMHYSTASTFAGVPVYVASASCYTMDLAREDRVYSGGDGSQAFAMVHLFDDGAGGVPGAPVVHTTVPLADSREVEAGTRAEAELLATLTMDEVRALFRPKHEGYHRSL